MPVSARAHRVRRCAFSVSVPRSDQGFGMRAELRGGAESVLLPALCRAFDALHVGDEEVHIPRLVLRLRIDPTRGATEQIAHQLQELVERELALRLEAPRRKVAPGAREGVREALQHRLLHYLRSGSLLWQDAAEEPLAHAGTLRGLALQLARRVRAEPSSVRSLAPRERTACTAFFFRWLQLLPESFQADWLTPLLAPALSADSVECGVPALQAWLQQTARETEHIRLTLRSQALAVSCGLLESGGRVRVHSSSDAALDVRVARLFNARPGTAVEGGATQGIGAEPTKEVAQTRPALAMRQAAAGNAANPEVPTASAPPSEVNHPARSTEPAPRADSLFHPASELAKGAVEAVFGLHVHFAGLVLAHPFIPALFANGGIVEAGGKRIARELTSQAALLLHWLATGRSEAFEFELGFIKALLGLHPDDAVLVADGLIDDADRRECIALLEALIAHWPALRSTSADSLRSSFLQRRGLLRAASGAAPSGWQLQPEAAPFDVLISRIPWGVGSVKLPWMSKPVFVTWPTS